MKLTRTYEETDFPASMVELGVRTFQQEVEASGRKLEVATVAATTAEGDWQFDSVDEVYAELRNNVRTRFELVFNGTGERGTPPGERRDFLSLSAVPFIGFQVRVELPSRPAILRVVSVFDDVAAQYRRPSPPKAAPPPPRIFIGHGRSDQWRDLKDHLQDKHDYDIEAYETGARAGHTIRDILQEMTDRSSMALLVMTAEDETAEGTWRARQNVIHETGLFQGALGWSRAIVLVEEGTEDYSNLQGIHQLRYAKGNIKETFGEVLATLKREFGS